MLKEELEKLSGVEEYGMKMVLIVMGVLFLGAVALTIINIS